MTKIEGSGSISQSMDPQYCREASVSTLPMFCLDSIISVHDIDLAVTNFPLISQVGGGILEHVFL
jgi:hypothetical protein